MRHSEWFATHARTDESHPSIDHGVYIDSQPSGNASTVPGIRSWVGMGIWTDWILDCKSLDHCAGSLVTFSFVDFLSIIPERR